MPNALVTLTVTAASIGLLHTLLGPDHYLPFIAMSRARRWSLLRTMLVTVLCGLGHVAGSVVLGCIGIALGLAASRLELIESFRGSLAAWAMIAFGLVYLAWGLRRAWRSRPHEHGHSHGGDDLHEHRHTHLGEHSHVHGERRQRNLTPWVLFTLFVFGPCEPLIPLLMYPAAAESVWGLCLVTVAFAVVTIATMLGVVLALSFGAGRLPLRRLERWGHALAGGMVLLCGIAVKLGL